MLQKVHQSQITEYERVFQEIRDDSREDKGIILPPQAICPKSKQLIL